jgi:lysozyme
MDITTQLIRDEGERLKPYKDTVCKLTIGVGRNLTDVGISHDESMLLLKNDIIKATAQLLARLPWVAQLDEARRGVLVNMTFNMGVDGLLQFKQTLAHIQAGQWNDAAADMLNSKWAQQVGDRAKRLAQQLITGQWM